MNVSQHSLLFDRGIFFHVYIQFYEPFDFVMSKESPHCNTQTPFKGEYPGHIITIGSSHSRIENKFNLIWWDFMYTCLNVFENSSRYPLTLKAVVFILLESCKFTLKKNSLHKLKWNTSNWQTLQLHMVPLFHEKREPVDKT